MQPRNIERESRSSVHRAYDWLYFLFGPWSLIALYLYLSSNIEYSVLLCSLFTIVTCTSLTEPDTIDQHPERFSRSPTCHCLSRIVWWTLFLLSNTLSLIVNSLFLSVYPEPMNFFVCLTNIVLLGLGCGSRLYLQCVTCR